MKTLKGEKTVASKIKKIARTAAVKKVKKNWK